MSPIVKTMRRLEDYFSKYYPIGVICNASDPRRDRQTIACVSPQICRDSRPRSHERDLRTGGRASEDREKNGGLNQRSPFGTTRQTTKAVRKTLPKNAARPEGSRTKPSAKPISTTATHSTANLSHR